MKGKDFLAFLVQEQKLTQTQAFQCLQSVHRLKKPLSFILLEQKLLGKETLRYYLSAFKKQISQTNLSPLSSSDPSPLKLNAVHSEKKEESEVPPASFLGKYEILRLIAQGGMGKVYYVRHSQLKNFYALKILISGQDASSEEIQRFHQEAQMTAQLKHPAIVTVMDSGEIEGQHYFVMEYIKGISWDQWWKQEKSLRKRLENFQKVLDALDYAHHQGVLHRDLKPDHILMTPEGEPKIVDFGVAKAFKKEKNLHLTQTGSLLGTPSYMSPEQIRGETLDERSDLYALGVCLYQMLTKRLPFSSQTIHELFYKVNYAEVPSPSRWNKDLHWDLETIVLKVLEKKREKRYPSAKAFARDIERFLKGYPILAKPSTLRERFFKWSLRNHRKLQALAFCLLALILCCGGLFWNEIQEQKRFQKTQQKLYLQYLQKAEECYTYFQEKQTQLPLEQQLTILLQAFSQSNLALQIRPQDLEAEQRKYQIGATLIQLACQSKIYELAFYLYEELKTLTFLEAEEKDKFLFEIKKQQTQQLASHQERLKYWKEEFLQGRVQPESIQEALFEYSTMEEPEIFQEFLRLLEESVSFILKGIPFCQPYYQTIITALGRMERPESGATFLKALQKLNTALEEQKKPNLQLEHWMILLTQAFAYSQSADPEGVIASLRRRYGFQSLFSQETESSAQDILQRSCDTSSRRNALSLYQQGLLALQEKDYKNASNAFQKSQDSAPWFTESTYSLAYALFCSKDYEDAQKAFQLCLQETPDYREAYWFLAKIALTQGEEKRAEEAFQEYLRPPRSALLSPYQKEEIQRAFPHLLKD
jgi:serine/threonine protein kinase